jgi:signal transduction histidine kinase
MLRGERSQVLLNPAKRRFALSHKVVLAMLFPSLVAFVAFGFLARRAAGQAVEAELGRRLQTVAKLLSQSLSDESLALLQPGDENSRTHRNLRKRLLETQHAIGLSRVYVFASDFTIRVDTGNAKIGEREYGLDGSRTELARMLSADATVRTASSVLFAGHDGRLYKTGFAAVSVSLGPPQFAVAVEGNAAIYADLLQLRKTLLLVGALAGVLLTGLAIALGRRVSLPLTRLSEGAQNVGCGVLDQAVPSDLCKGQDEIAVLAQTLETMRQGLLARDERMQMMLAGIAHEVRNPLGGMELFAGLLREELTSLGDEQDPKLETARTYLQRIGRELAHLQKIVADFLLYARRPAPALETIEIVGLLHEIKDSVQAKDANVHVQVVCETDSPVFLRVDPAQMRRAIENVAQNAVQACQGKSAGQVTLSVKPEPAGFVTLRITDNGPGIPDEVLSKIWTPFFTTRAQGTGLGLPFAREIVLEHQGTLRVQTSPQGTTFLLQLPKHTPHTHPLSNKESLKGAGLV